MLLGEGDSLEFLHLGLETVELLLDFPVFLLPVESLLHQLYDFVFFQRETRLSTLRLQAGIAFRLRQFGTKFETEFINLNLVFIDFFLQRIQLEDNFIDKFGVLRDGFVTQVDAET